MLAGLGRSYEPADLFSIEICFHALAYSFPIFVRAAHDLSKHNITKAPFSFPEIANLIQNLARQTPARGMEGTRLQDVFICSIG